MKSKGDRKDRIGDLIQKGLATLLLGGMGDERFRFVTVSGVSVARDLSYAKVHVSMLYDDPVQIKAVMEALNHASKLLRFNLCKIVSLRVMPELKFSYDESTAVGFRMNELIDAAMKKGDRS